MENDQICESKSDLGRLHCASQNLMVTEIMFIACKHLSKFVFIEDLNTLLDGEGGQFVSLLPVVLYNYSKNIQHFCLVFPDFV